jgi:hypothetical protein
MPPGYKVCGNSYVVYYSMLIRFVGALRQSVRRLSADSCGLESALLSLVSSHYVIMLFGAKNMAISSVDGQIPPIVWWAGMCIETYIVVSALSIFQYCSKVISKVGL